VSRAAVERPAFLVLAVIINVKSPKSKSKPSASPAPSTPRAPVSKKRRFAFALFAVISPILLVAAIECGLRLGGYGYPTSFFVRERIGERDFYVPNDRFGFRFFPPAIARTPFALRMPADKPATTYRIFLFGESAAQGDPDPTYGVGRFLQVLLRERFPGTDFEVVCVAMTAINSHAILPIARECARLQGDLWIIYMGNNEVVGPFGPGTVFGPQAPPAWLVRVSLAAKAMKVGQLLENFAARFGSASSAPKTWGGMSMFKEHQMRADAPGRLRAQRNFASNLDAILGAGRSAGAQIILSTVGSNLKDCAPFSSLHKPTLSSDQQAAWESDYKAGIAAQQAGDCTGALKSFAQAATLDPDFAELHFRRGQCELALANLAEAKRAFELARDWDALGFRADGPLNRIIKQAGGRHTSSEFRTIDAAEVLASASPGGIAGEELFYEHVHLNFDGNYRLARLFAEQVQSLLIGAITNRMQSEWASSGKCERQLAISPWDRYRVWMENFSRVSEPPFTEQLNDVSRAKMYMAKLETLRAEINPASQSESRKMYAEAVAAAPEDVALLGNYAQFLGELGDFSEAVKQQQRVCELLPHSAPGFHKCGLLLVRQAKMEDAAFQFARCLALRADYAPALNELAEVRVHQQKLAEAEALFREAIRLKPGYIETYINLGFMQQENGRLAEGMEHYREAARLQPNGPAAHFNRAVALASEHQRNEAIKLFQAAVFMNPSFWQARYLLGVELAMADHPAEAEDQFVQVARLRPDFVKGRINLGVALTKHGKLEEALAEFQAALQLSPTNQAARRNADMVQALKARAR
jgi:tetratricopeptide (TPR) repeat protein